MTDPESTPALRLPGRTTPTWDMELLVSAGSVFALLQLPGWLDQAYLAVFPRLDLEWDVLARTLYTYCKLGVLMLAAAFTVHLLMRAYWIALIGMDSIYPEGVLWDRMQLGPRMREFQRANEVPIRTRIELADNRASIVFALGLTLAMAMGALVVAAGLSYVVCLGLSRAFGWSWLLPDGIFAIMMLAIAPYLLVSAADRAWGERMAPGGWPARVVDAVIAVYARLGLGRGGNPTLGLLQSHVGLGKTMALMLGAMLACSVVAVAQLALLKGSSMPLGDYARWPTADVGATDSFLSGHYRDLSPPESSLLPTIESAFPEGDYLTLVVPFDPKRHPAALAPACPKAWGAGPAAPARREALLACFGRWLAPTLDGAPMPAPRLRYFTDPRSGQQAVLAVVPIAALAAGEHELGVRRAASRQKLRKREATTYRIVFWRQAAAGKPPLQEPIPRPSRPE